MDKIKEITKIVTDNIEIPANCHIVVNYGETAAQLQALIDKEKAEIFKEIKVCCYQTRR